MNKNFKVITINGIRGIFAAVFIVMGLIAGFIISPGWLAMSAWNHFFAESGRLASMNLIQGIMLWAIVALSLYALNDRKTLIGFGAYQGLTPEQMKDIIARAKISEEKIKSDIEKLSMELKAKSESIDKDKNIEQDKKQNEEKSEEVGVIHK